MDSLNLADTFVTFLALIGPQKVLLSFGRLARTLDDRSVRAVAAATAGTAAAIGALCALTAPWVVTFFHIGAPELNLAAGLLFIIYAIGLTTNGSSSDRNPLVSGCVGSASSASGSSFAAVVLCGRSVSKWMPSTRPTA